MAASKRRAHYCVRIAKMICENIALGMTLGQAREEVGYLAPSRMSVWRWLEEYPEFRAMHERALVMQAHSHADKIVELAEVALKNPKVASAVKVASDSYKWSAEMRDPQRFSPKAAQEVKPSPKSVEAMRDEIDRLQRELGVEHAQPAMVTAPRQRPPALPAPAPKPVSDDIVANVLPIIETLQ